MQNLLADLARVLATDSRLVVDGKLLKNKVVELALALDEGLLKLLLHNEATAKHFFTKVGAVAVFDKVKFQAFVANKQFLPDSYTSFKNKIGLIVDGRYLTDSGEVVLAWPYKDCVLEGGQTKEDAKRDEIFWNETLAPDEIDRLLAPKALTGFTRLDRSGKKRPSELRETDSYLIKGNNLLTLHSLKHAFAQRVDVIYIDPPFNPESKANTFCYNNSFNRSTWLTFMSNRLAVAKELLAPTGALIVAIDDNEQVHLGVLLKEMFRDHDIHCITIVHNPRGVQGTNFSATNEFAFFVIPKGQKTIIDRKISDEEIEWAPLRNWGTESLRADAKNCFYPIIIRDGQVVGFGEVCPDEVHPKPNVRHGKDIWVYPIDSKQIERKWRYARQSVEAIRDLLRVKQTAHGYDIELGKDFGTYRTVWQDPRYDSNKYGTQLVKELVPGCHFDFPKSIWNVYDCLYAVVGKNKNAIVLDFFGGSGTTAHAVLELNKADAGARRFILSEQMDYVENVTLKRIHNVIKRDGQGSFVYCELCPANEAFMEQIRQAKKTEDLQKIWAQMRERAFFSYRVDADNLSPDSVEFANLPIGAQRELLIESLDKNMLYVPLSDIDDAQFEVSESDKRLTHQLLTR